MATAAASDLESKAKAAFVDDDFELAAELYTQAIEASPATAELYADRAQAHIKLGNYTGNPSLAISPFLPFLRLDWFAVCAAVVVVVWGVCVDVDEIVRRGVCGFVRF